jgi:hypothetical protein
MMGKALAIVLGVLVPATVLLLVVSPATEKRGFPAMGPERDDLRQ